MDIRRILVPVDFSGNAQRALGAAQAFAATFNAELRLLHVVESSPYEVYVQKGFRAHDPFYVPIADTLPGSAPHVVVKNLMDEAKVRLDQMAGAGTRSSSTVRHGRPVDEILREVDAYKPDLVVMCTHGWSGVKHLLLGSVTERIVRQCPVSVLTVRAQE